LLELVQHFVHMYVSNLYMYMHACVHMRAFARLVAVKMKTCRSLEGTIDQESKVLVTNITPCHQCMQQDRGLLSVAAAKLNNDRTSRDAADNLYCVLGQQLLLCLERVVLVQLRDLFV